MFSRVSAAAADMTHCISAELMNTVPLPRQKLLKSTRNRANSAITITQSTRIFTTGSASTSTISDAHLRRSRQKSYRAFSKPSMTAALSRKTPLSSFSALNANASLQTATSAEHAHTAVMKTHAATSASTAENCLIRQSSRLHAVQHAAQHQFLNQQSTCISTFLAFRKTTLLG